MSSISGITPFAEPLVPPVGLPPGAGIATAPTAVTDLQSISADLQSGDFTSAQNTFNSLTQLVGSGGISATSPALDALGNALQSGNASAAGHALSLIAKNVVGHLQGAAANRVGHPIAVKRIDALIASLEAIPGVSESSTPVAQSASSNSGGDGAKPSGGNGLNVIA